MSGLHFSREAQKSWPVVWSLSNCERNNGTLALKQLAGPPPFVPGIDHRVKQGRVLGDLGKARSDIREKVGPILA